MAELGFYLGINKRLITKFSDKLFLDKRFIAGTLVPDALESIGISKGYSHFYRNYILKYPTFESLKTLSLEQVEFDNSAIAKEEKGIKIEQFLKYNTYIHDNDPYKLGIIMHLFSDYVYNKLPSDVLFDLNSAKKNGIEQYTYSKHNITELDIFKIYEIVDEVFSLEMAKYIRSEIIYDKSVNLNKYDRSNIKHLNDFYKKIDTDYLSFQKKLIK